MKSMFVPAPALARAEWRPLPLLSARRLGQQPTPQQPVPLQPSAPASAVPLAFIDSPAVGALLDAAAAVSAGMLGHIYGKVAVKERPGYHRLSVMFWVIAAGAAVKGIMDLSRIQR
jgi:hypothetical protein